MDTHGSLYIADAGNHRIRKVSNGVITTVAGNGTLGYSGDGGLATIAQLNSPSGISVDSAGNLYIADTKNNAVRKVINGVITTIAGNGTAGFSGDTGPAINTPSCQGPTELRWTRPAPSTSRTLGTIRSAKLQAG